MYRICGSAAIELELGRRWHQISTAKTSQEAEALTNELKSWTTDGRTETDAVASADRNLMVHPLLRRSGVEASDEIRPGLVGAPPGSHQRPECLSCARRRYRHQYAADDAVGLQGDPGVAGRGGWHHCPEGGSWSADGSQGKFGRHPVADLPRICPAPGRRGGL